MGVRRNLRASWPLSFLFSKGAPGAAEWAAARNDSIAGVTMTSSVIYSSLPLYTGAHVTDEKTEVPVEVKGSAQGYPDNGLPSRGPCFVLGVISIVPHTERGRVML